jgi:hypothetical protein
MAAPPVRPTPKPGIASVPGVTPRKAVLPTTAPRVRVLNAVGRKGLAGRYTTYLTSRGWSSPRAADASRRRSLTVIFYPAGSRAQAAALAKRLPFRATLVASNGNSSDLLLVLGNDALAFDNRLRFGISRT